MNIEWDGDTLPPVGTVCEYSVNGGAGNRFWCKVLFLGNTYAVLQNEAYQEVIDVVTSISFHPIKSDKEKWVDAALKLDCEPSDGMLSRKDFCGVVYDAIQSGKLPTIKVTK